MAKSSLAQARFLAEEIKDNIQELYREMEDLEFYTLVKNAIIENPNLDDFKERNLDSILKKLHRTLDLKKKKTTPQE